MKNIIKMQVPYKMVGFLNLLDIVPDFVEPVFQRGKRKKEYYIQTGNVQSLTLKRFIPVKKLYVDKIIIFDNKVIVNDCKIKQVSLKSEPIFGFQYANDSVFVGTYEEIKRFLEEFKTDDDILKEEIRDFIEITGSKKRKK